MVPLNTRWPTNRPSPVGRPPHLARAAAAGLPVLPGFVLVPAARVPGIPTGPQTMRATWRTPTGPGGGGRGRSAARSAAVVRLGGRDPDPAGAAPAAESTTTVFTVQTRDGDLRLAADDLWATRRRSTAAQNEDAGPSRVAEASTSVFLRPPCPRTT